MGVAPGQGRARTHVKMVDLRQDNIINQPTVVHCEKDVKCWPTLRSLAAMVAPSCSCGCSNRRTSKKKKKQAALKNAAVHNHNEGSSPPLQQQQHQQQQQQTASRLASSQLGSIVTGTIFGHRKGKVSICIQDDPRSPPAMILELAMPTFLLVKEMSSGLLRIAMECDKDDAIRKPLHQEPVWTMFCNGRKVGFAVRRACSESDRSVLHLMQSVSMGAGVIPIERKNSSGGGDGGDEDDDLMYMRATYERVVGSQDSESFHMINPDGSPGQELSIFFMRA